MFEEVQCYLYVLQFVEAHPAFLSWLMGRTGNVSFSLGSRYWYRYQEMVCLLYW